ncbi:DUF11 domain-containing protein [Nocardioides sp. MAH-18]|uniref:DUF11 domain-containing protein n=1 Tax=Nocardioides agri TaxID=2682843 RepID=A0A6L6XLX1_9ACTN|nr:DUF11 domain-containing protein [Nocardioides sp. MAH-18]
MANDTDADGDTLTVTGKTNGAHGTVTCTTTTCTYTPAAGYNGTDSFTYTISDGHGGTDTGTVTVTITGVSGADVSVTNSALLAQPKIGSLSGYRVVVTNTGAALSGAVTLTDRLPTAFKVRSVTPSTCSAPTGTLTCVLGALAPGQKVTIEVTGAFVRGGRISDTATIKAVGDPNPVNDTAIATLSVRGASCTVVGTFGDDDLSGTRRDDVICGLAGNDRIAGGAGDDILYGNERDDVLLGGRGDDTIDGGPGEDTASFAGSDRGVRCDLLRARATGEGTDVIVDVEDLVGSRYADQLYGDDEDNTLWGGPGDDTLVGRGGRDRVHQGPGHGTVRP